jgi:hypothetical protein
MWGPVGLLSWPEKRGPGGNWRARRALSDVQREARRVAADREYRRERLRGLRRVCRVSAAAYSPERYAEAEAAERLARALGLPARAEARDVYPIPVRWQDLPYTPTAKDASTRATLGLPRRDHAAGSTEWDGKGRPHYTRATDDSLATSAAAVSRGTLRYWFQAPEGERSVSTHSAPAGCRWDFDANGLRLVCGPDDYHPTSAELRRGTDRMLAQLRANADTRRRLAAENAETRRRLAAERAVERAEAAGVWVCLADSLRAGNCRAGSETWAARHGLDVRRHVEAGILFDHANGDWARVRLAIRAALTRHARELAQGFAVLAEHTV